LVFLFPNPLHINILQYLVFCFSVLKQNLVRLQIFQSGKLLFIQCLCIHKLLSWQNFQIFVFQLFIYFLRFCTYACVFDSFLLWRNLKATFHLKVYLLVWCYHFFYYSFNRLFYIICCKLSRLSAKWPKSDRSVTRNFVWTLAPVIKVNNMLRNN